MYLQKNISHVHGHKIIVANVCTAIVTNNCHPPPTGTFTCTSEHAACTCTMYVHAHIHVYTHVHACTILYGHQSVPTLTRFGCDTLGHAPHSLRLLSVFCLRIDPHQLSLDCLHRREGGRREGRGRGGGEEEGRGGGEEEGGEGGEEGRRRGGEGREGRRKGGEGGKEERRGGIHI